MSRRPVVVLPDSLVNVIAAGEVIERPSSVVKELLENALDAGAGRVVVRLQDGGRRLVSVEDDGEGMSEEDALLAIERHATSKIAVQADLGDIRTLGFRGEALPSIAAVGGFVLESRDEGSPAGTRITMDCGRLMKVEACGRPRGTSVALRGIFSKLPARRKFLKSRETELSWCLRVVEDLALAYPRVHLEVHSDQSTALSFPPVEGLRDRIAALWGPDTAHGLSRMRWEDEGLSIEGYLSPPSETYPRRSRHHVLVNGRPVRDPGVNRAVSSALAGRYPPGRFPALVLSLRLPPGDLDVNVHPSKREVRIRDLNGVASAMRDAVERLDFSPSGLREALPAAGSPTDHPAVYSHPPPPASRSGRAASGGPAYGSGEAADLPLERRQRVLGQHLGTYIITQSGHDLRLVDQHAAHERIVYNRLMESRGKGDPSVQRLLVPELVELSGSEAKNLLARQEVLSSFGFEIEPFGGDSVRLLSVPAAITTRKAGDLLKAVAADLSEIPDLPEEIGLLVSRWACRMSVTAGRVLSMAEMEKLITDLETARSGYACPHGRPTSVSITPADLEKLFGRR
ncbi:MAG: DNA mismatch repair endonuclease MutL [bacterium]|nr:MAG: DNA mismatch repair endonuclease MutL [bacterium]